MIDSLEPRYLRSATLDPNTGVLVVVGTDKPNVIEFSREHDAHGVSLVRVHEDGVTNDFLTDDVKSIDVSALAGADVITLGGLLVPSVIDGGKGNDSISGGDGSDTIIGGGGENYLFGRGGDDRIIAGLGKDTIFGDKGNDTIIPDNTPTADDTISGGSGYDIVDYSASTIAVKAEVGGTPKANAANDIIQSDIEVIYGGELADTITNGTKHPLLMFGKGGNDTLTGGSGNDTLDGGSGLDSLLGMGGKDHFRSKDGKIDTLDGGAGLDFIENSDTVIIADVVSNI